MREFLDVFEGDQLGGFLTSHPVEIRAGKTVQMHFISSDVTRITIDVDVSGKASHC